MTQFVLKNHLDPQAVCLRVKAPNADAVIGVLADRLAAIGVVAQTWKAAAIAREAAMPTGLPLADDFAVAVPHTDPEHVLRAGLAVATLETPVAFRSMDDPDATVPARVVFAIALRDKHAQIDMLQTIAGLLQSPEQLRRMASAKDSDEFFAALDQALEPIGGGEQ
jgi:PTS system galactitol-specific IIA component